MDSSLISRLPIVSHYHFLYNSLLQPLKNGSPSSYYDMNKNSLFLMDCWFQLFNCLNITVYSRSSSKTYKKIAQFSKCDVSKPYHQSLGPGQAENTYTEPASTPS
jgi:hypothetical protein